MVLGHLYADGGLVLTAAEAPEEGREALASGRLCAQARYAQPGHQAWYSQRMAATSATVEADMAGYACANLDYAFYAHQSLASVAGLANLNGTRELRFAFCGCSALEEADLSGFDPSALEDVGSCFQGCSALETVWADAGWELPEGCAGFATFHGCTALAGGARTTYDEGRIAGTYMRIDGGEAAPGYLTAKAG